VKQLPPKLLIGEKPIDRLHEPPATGWVLKCFGTPLTIEGKQYPHNGIVPLSALKSRNTDVLLRQGRLRWAPPSMTASLKPKQVDPPVSAKPHREVVLIGADDLDAVSAWKRTLDHMAKLHDGDYQTAADRIRGYTVVKHGIACQPGLALYLRAKKQNYDQQVRSNWIRGGALKPLYGDL